MDHACHHCDYDLMGLPAKGACPECGQAYDKHSLYRAIQSRETPITRHFKWAFLAAFTLIVLLAGSALAMGQDNPLGVLTVTLVIAAVSGFGAFTYWWSDKQEKRGEL